MANDKEWQTFIFAKKKLPFINRYLQSSRIQINDSPNIYQHETVCEMKFDTNWHKYQQNNWIFHCLEKLT